MGNSGSSSSAGAGASHRRRNRNHPHPPPPPAQPPQPDINGNQYVFAASTPYPPHPPQFPNSQPGYYQYPGYYPPPPHTMHLPLPAPYDHHHRVGPRGEVAHNNWAGMRCGPVPPPMPYVEHQKAVTIRNDVNLKKETLRVEVDEENPGRYLVAFTFDATVAGSITIYFFAKEEEDCDLKPTKESLQPITVSFQQGLGQLFRQPSGTGIDFSKFEESELLKEGEMQIYPLVVKAEAAPLGDNESESGNTDSKPTNSQITQALFEKKEGGEYQVRVAKQILWVNGMRYELQEIYGIGNSVDNDFDGNDPGKECVICLSEPRDTTVLPCRHMCMCSGCAKVLRFQTNRCPICRQPVERLLEIKVSKPDDQETTPC